MHKLRAKPRKKSYIILGLFLAVILMGVILWVPPEGLLIKLLFFLLFFTSLFYLLRFALNQTRRVFLISSGLTVYMILRALDLRHWLYLLLIGALIISVEVYYRHER